MAKKKPMPSDGAFKGWPRCVFTPDLNSALALIFDVLSDVMSEAEPKAGPPIGPS